ncbi:MAG: ribosome biogenesis GTP-binding protein YihA/YsxC [Oscillospiraceae bacterium]|jgi:GTP-binding protein|nr:ribosome biogenesis GTP-binding protein YihA/YsxC [Oscillospiraceae bacterium]
MSFDVKDCEFVKTAAHAADFISDGRPQIVFSGRSNVGKSSVINCLVRRKNLARSSSSPGKTANVNYFLVNNKVYFVDLPGYGYARAPDYERRRWGRLIESFFGRRELITLGVMLVDMRHTPTADDRTMAEWFRRSERPFVVVANKSDKVKSALIDERLADIRGTLSLEDGARVMAFSAEKGVNRDALTAVIGEFIR